ncbi:glycolate oxidase subunit GlcE [Hydromonas duriensis]|uniref:Glycolate oxidase FAD binding subunit n=1 Tax=Hydromonas duriensis TaxID=1527608 RepID=A0A4R6Y186_9BURK|nr:glycolate oxidase subunit GlcE [Hydromonas duriensis]TDR29065.1 glycolate oxidase FAD binding subunit [Hydromonas duriensis]
MERILQRWQQQIEAAHANQEPLRIRGAGTKDFFGHLEGELLETTDLKGIIDYEPTELVVTVRAGTPWSDLEQALKEKNQYLPFEPPFVSKGATVGGVINAGWAGAARLYVGGIWDYVLGAQLFNFKGDLLTFGGNVMKNVAGYDVSRLLVGSMGGLGVMTQVSLKVLPQPVMSCTVQLNCDFSTAQQLCRQFLVKPIVVVGTAWFDGVLTVRLAGVKPAIAAGLRMLDEWAKTLTSEPWCELEDELAFWTDLNEQTHPYFSQPPSDKHALWRAVLPTAVNGLDVHADAGLGMWGGALRWLWALPEENLISRFQVAGGHAIIYRRALNMQDDVMVHTDVEPNLRALQLAVKSQFDPQHIFNRHRLGLGEAKHVS